MIDDRFQQMRDIAPIIRYHHERWDVIGPLFPGRSLLSFVFGR